MAHQCMHIAHAIPAALLFIAEHKPSPSGEGPASCCALCSSLYT